MNNSHRYDVVVGRKQQNTWPHLRDTKQEGEGRPRKCVCACVCVLLAVCVAGDVAVDVWMAAHFMQIACAVQTKNVAQFWARI